MEDKIDHVLVYIPEVGGIRRGEPVWCADVFGVDCCVVSSQIKKDEVISHKVVLLQEHPIMGQKPAVVKLYDYYEPSKGAPPPSRLCPR